MPRLSTTVTIFLASPSDVATEREIISRTVDKWNHIQGRHRGVYFDLLRWETSVSSGFSTDGQAVINEQIGLDYDVLIGIFWSRLGTSTPRSQSGSTEEYERALERFRQKEPVDIAFYFKDAPIELNKIDPSQIDGLRNLQTQISSDGALYKTFKDEDGLKFEIDLLLDRLSKKYSDLPAAHEGSADTASLPKTQSQPLPQPITEVEPGWLDINEDLERHSEEAGAFLTELSTKLESMAEITAEISSSLEETGRLGLVTPAVIKPLLTRVSTAMDDFSQFVENKGEKFSNNSSDLSNDVRQLIDISRDFDHTPEDVLSFKNTLNNLIDGMDNTLDELNGLLKTTASLQRMTTSFNHSKKRLVINISFVINAISSSRSILGEAIKEFAAIH